MNLEKRIEAFAKLGEVLSKNVFPDELFKRIEINNPWFIRKNVEFSIKAISSLLTKDKLIDWISKYPKIRENKEPKIVAVVTAGNIPLVGFHDFLSVLITGNIILIKLSSKDNILLKEIANLLIEVEPEFKDKIIFTDKIIKNFDAIITTGSDNSSNYFSHYFDKYPHIIRKNRNSVALLTGDESDDEIELLTEDIFMYFGLGCRNVSKVYLPKNYKIDRLFESFVNYGDIINHNKYGNNYDYNRSIYMMNNFKFLENSFVILKEDVGFSSPISVLYYEYYDDINQVINNLELYKDNIQVIIANVSKKFTKFGKAQKPDLYDYADGIDTIEFLLGI
jgi:hypothetical protein